MKDQVSFENSFEVVSYAGVLISDHLEIIDINAYLQDLLLIKGNHEYIGRSVLEIVSPKDHQRFLDLIISTEKRTKEPYWEIIRVIPKDRTEKLLLVNITKANHKHRLDEGILIVGLPITNEISSENFSSQIDQHQSGRSSFNKYENLFRNATFGIAVLDNNGFIQVANIAFCEHCGVNNCEVLNKHFSEIFIDQPKEKLERLTNLLSKSKHTYVKDVLAVKSQSGESRIIEISLSGFFDIYDNSKKLMLFSEDITQQQDTHAALLQSEKLALTGRLAASLAHEINNPLQTSLGCLGLVEEMLTEDDQDLAVYIDMAIEELQRSARIVKKLRDLNRTSDLSERSPVNLKEIIDGVLVLTQNHLNDRDIVPVFPFQGPPPVIIASKDHIQQVILNLVMNAIDELPDGGNIYFNIIKSEEPKGISVSIRDTGSGIDPEIQDNIFDPFFSTKEDGIGLGLYICKEIIEDHAGTLSFKSEMGQGTEFSLWLPAFDNTPHKEKSS
jgi:PAS domain S-box-containing protein